LSAIQVAWISAIYEILCLPQLLWTALERVIAAASQFFYSRRIDVETDDGPPLAELDG
jgi:hypothetical protein